METSLNRSTSGAGESRKLRLAKLALALEPWFHKWRAAFPTHAQSKLQMATYIEALDDLTPDELDAGCREATRVAEQFPKPGHIRKGLAAAHNEVGYIGGARVLNYEDPGLTETQRIEIIQECRARLVEMGVNTSADPKPTKRLERPRIYIFRSREELTRQRDELLAKATPEELQRAKQLLELK